MAPTTQAGGLALAIAALIGIASCGSDAAPATPSTTAAAPTTTTATATTAAPAATELEALHAYLADSPLGCSPTMADGAISVTTVNGIAFCMRTLWDGLVVAGSATPADVEVQRKEFDDFLFDATLEVAGGGGSLTHTACVGSRLQLRLDFTVTDGQGDGYVVSEESCP